MSAEPVEVISQSVLTSDQPPSTEQAASALGLLIPVARADLSWEPALVEIERFVARLEPGPVAAVADWWLIAGAGRPSQDCGAYLLPEDELGEKLARWMTAVRDLDTHVPPLRWVARRAELDGLVARARQLLDLEAHGNVKMPALRTIWRDLVVAVLEPVVRALELGRPAPGCEIDAPAIEDALDEANIIRNSDVWRVLLRRVDDARQAVDRAAACHGEVEPWRPREDPGVWSEPLPGTGRPLGQVLNLALEREPDDAAVLGRQLGREAAVARGGDLLRLEHWTRGFRRATGVVVRELEEVARRRVELQERAASLGKAGAAPDDVQLALEAVTEGDFDYARTLLDDCQRQIETAQHLARLRSEVEELVGLTAATPAFEARGAELRQLLAAGDHAGLEPRLRALRVELAATARASRLEQVGGLVEELEQLGAGGPLLVEGRQMLELLRRESGPLPSATEIDALQDRVRQTGIEARRRVERVIAVGETMLAERGDQLAARDQAEVEGMLRAARERFGEGALRKAEELATDARAQIERRQVPIWTARKGEAELVRHLVAYLTQAASFAPRDILRLHVALKTKRFVILAGLTGSGKSTIARLYAEALGATVENGRLWRVAVRPNWVDETEVLGYLNPLNGMFAPGWLATLIRACQRDPDLPFFCVLDEMNLAPVEQYLADALSAMEEARSGSTDVRIPLYAPGARPQNAADWEATLPWPANLFLIGTVNIDETTRAISDRVLDRANVLQLSVAFGESHHLTRRRDTPERPWLVRFSEWLAICRDEPADTHHDLLIEIARRFVRMRIGLGMRNHVEVERFLANAAGVMDGAEALDFAVLQRIVPKVRGFKRELLPGLRDLRQLLGAGFPRSGAVLDDWLSEEIADEAFLDGTDARVGLVAG